MTAGDRMFVEYLREQSYKVPEHEPDLGTVKRPDFLVERQGERCVVEVKEFAPTTRSFPDQPSGSTDLATVLKPVRGKLREAARQLKETRELELPLVAVLTNPHGATVMLGEREVIWAMYGDPVVRMDIDRSTGAAVGEPQHGVGRNGRLARDHQYVSAVAVLSRRAHASDWLDQLRSEYDHLPFGERWDVISQRQDAGECPDGDYHRLDVYRTLSADAVPLPDLFFDGPYDRLFEPDEAGAAYVQVRGPQRGR